MGILALAVLRRPPPVMSSRPATPLGVFSTGRRGGEEVGFLFLIKIRF
jgi:hypothetical protein